MSWYEGFPLPQGEGQGEGIKHKRSSLPLCLAPIDPLTPTPPTPKGGTEVPEGEGLKDSGLGRWNLEHEA